MATNQGYVDDNATGMTSFSITSAPTKTASEEGDQVHAEITIEGVAPRSSRSSSVSSIEHNGPYAGMPKEVLLKYSRQRKFVWARNILMGLVILTILALIALVIAIIVISPPCLQYWQTSPIYQVYPKSFKDSWTPDPDAAEGETDGIGDIYGVIDQLDYFEELGVRMLWLNPIYDSPQKDNGYDISDFRDIDEVFGGMTAFDLLIEDMHSRGMKLIMDFVPNHSSNQHEWFLASSNTSHPNFETYKDYYMWIETDDSTVLPNNWVSEFDNASAWTYNDDRKSFYFHGFYAEQPDLNLRNPTVKEELKDILRFWMDRGVDGFRCDAIGFMLEAEHLRDNPLKDPTVKPNKDTVYPDYTQNYKGVHDIVAEWRVVLDDFSTEPGVYRFMQTEVYTDDIQETIRYYGTDRAPEGDFPMNFLLITADPETEWNAQSMKDKVLKWMRNMPQGRWPSWTVSNHDNPRLPSRVGVGRARCAAVMIMTLPGTPGFYYGDEIGMTDNNNIPSDQSNDFRDPERTPMQWNAGNYSGFCDNCDPWLPVNDDYKNINVEKQRDDENSMLEMYKTLISLRQGMVYQRGYFCMLQVQGNTLAFVRELPGLISRMILINFDTDGNSDTTIDMAKTYGDFLSNTGRVTFISTISDTVHNVGDNLEFSKITLEASRGIILEFESPGRLFHEASEEGSSIECYIHQKVCYDNALGIVKVC